MSRLQSQDATSEVEFQEALRTVLDAKTLLPRASHTEDVLAWHTQQVRQHFAQHVMPLLSACAAGPALASSGLATAAGARRTAGAAAGPTAASIFEQHLVAVMNSVRTLDGAFRQYDFGLSLILRGYHQRGVVQAQDDTMDVDMQDSPATAVELLAKGFRKDVRSLVGNSAPPELMESVRAVLVALISRILGFPSLQSAAGNAKLSKPSGSGPGRPGKSSSTTPSSTAGAIRPAPPSDEDPQVIAARQRLHELVGALADVGLAGERTQVLFAEIMDKLMSDFVHGAYAGTWASEDQSGAADATRTPLTARRAGLRSAASKLASRQQSCSSTLCQWVENHFSRIAFEVLRLISVDDESGTRAVSFTDVTKWKDIALGRLAALRVSELFDIVLHWPKSKSGLDDLRASVATPQRRLQLTDAFSAALQARLLHSSRSTLEILQVYIAMIRTFHVLDHSKVLLSRVVPSLQLYLCQREDAIRLVVTGLLANPDEIEQSEAGAKPSAEDAVFAKDTSVIAGPRGNKNLIELAVLLNDPTQQRRQVVEDDDADWNDMDWVPDPVDAGANYKRPKSEDVIGTLISALGAEDVFIKEFQNIIAERLLSSQGRFDQEIKVLQLLKKRFGEAALQSCDVMIRDVKESGRLDPYIRRAQFVAQFRTPRGGEEVEAEERDTKYTAKILSRLFWPDMEPDAFVLPAPVADKQQEYERGYERAKASRRLTWLNNYGQATVELELRDRTVSVECKTYEAAVIYAFQEEGGDQGGGGVRKSFDELWPLLQMDEDLLREALEFWTAQGVLRRVGGDTFVVVESLQAEQEAAPADDNGDEEVPAGGNSSKPGAGGGGNSAVSKQRQQQETVHWQYIVGMLTNSAASMPTAQIAMMMRMMIPGGLPWSNEELHEFLGAKVAAGELEVVGGKYRLVKK
ncbi:anaphase-promoting complex subunit 2 [Magnaporthiopsis poae ATCC 64411]|uniref:Anaphase-promoting complex subunit 2 n=1 Tax=Magnaporthiopsis poae (strain ATCC 64411 / 73-15) TaxID=644358 RepID=A0A0C4E1S8_MAGP6|nr:anaphase-promoting complex subunit 2 [Magnaporthiopsis poae ATCC 64411]